MDKQLNIVFWGEDSFSNVVLNSLIEAGHNIKMVITPYYENFIYQRLELSCIKNDIPFKRCKNINSKEMYQLLKETKPDLCVISHFERLIKLPLLSVPKMGFINLHPSMLPDYRGMAPQHWPIINGESETGVTVHYVDEGVDTGDIIIQEAIPLYGNEYVSDLQKRWLVIYKRIMVEAIDRILVGTKTKKQKDLAGSYYGKLRVEQCQININSDVDQVYNLIRGVSMPYHGAQLGNVIIWRAHKLNEIPQDIFSLPVGAYFNCSFMSKDEKNLLILRNGCLVIDKYQLVNN